MTKNSKREIGIDDRTTKLLFKWRNYQREFYLTEGINTSSKDQLVFTTITNHFISDTFLRRAIKQTLESTKLPHIIIHEFRHTHCSLLFEASVEMQNVKERLGHNSIRTTMNIYTHVMESERAKTADIFSDSMSNIMC